MIGSPSISRPESQSLLRSTPTGLTPSIAEPSYFPPSVAPTSTEEISSSSRHGTSRSRLLKGFYVYSIASEIWIIASGTLFIPIVIETYGRSNGRSAPDYEMACRSGEGTDSDVENEGEVAIRCAVKLLGFWLDTASFSLVVYSLSVAVQALTVISMGVLADDPHIRHRLLTLFATLGSIASIAFIVLPASSPVWPLCSVLALVANVSFGAGSVCLNAYLPNLARRSPQLSSAHETLVVASKTYRNLRTKSSTSSDDSTQLLLASQSLARATDTYNRLKGSETSSISSRGIALGYAAGITTLVLLLPIVSWTGGGVDATWPLRVAIAISGTLWLVGSLYASILLRPEADYDPSRPLKTIEEYGGVREAVRSSWRGLGKMLRERKRLPQTFRFLVGWFVLSDSFATVTSTAMLFAKTTLNLSTSSLIVIAVLTPLSGIAGSLSFPYLQPRYLLLTNHQMLRLLVLLALFVPLWGLSSLNSSIEMYGLSIVFGSVYGSFQSYSRTCYSDLIPTSQSARWYGVYSVTDKSSSFLGPLLVAAITNATGQIRLGFWLILGFFLVSIPLLNRVEMDQGSKDADRFERELEREGLSIDEDEEERDYESN